jgi:transposase
MVKMNQWHTIRTLKTQGFSIKEITRQAGLARNTVRRYLEHDCPLQRATPTHEEDSLTPFADDVELKLAHHLIGNRILNELRAQGYTAPRRTFYRHLAALKARCAQAQATVRFETLPGQQAQFDWAVYTLQFASLLTQVYVHSLILGYSRYQFFYPSLDCTQVSILGALEEGFRFFDGVPRELLVDNPKALVIRPRPQLRFNRTFLEFAGHYGIQPIACWPARPQTKGKVERPFQLLEEYFIKGNTFVSFSDFVAQLLRFAAESVNGRRHGTTGERPLDRFARERPALLPLPERRFIGTGQLWRKVSGDCLVLYNSNRYSVPHEYAYKPVWIRSRAGVELEIYAQDGQLIAQHPISPQSGVTVLQESHYRGLSTEASPYKAILVRRFLKRFPQAQTFLDRLLGQYRFNATQQLRRILSLAEEYPAELMQEAFEQALIYNTFSGQFLRGLLHARAAAAPATGATRCPLPAGVPQVDIRRGLQPYQILLEFPNDAPKREKGS